MPQRSQRGGQSHQVGTSPATEMASGRDDVCTGGGGSHGRAARRPAAPPALLLTRCTLLAEGSPQAACLKDTSPSLLPLRVEPQKDTAEGPGPAPGRSPAHSIPLGGLLPSLVRFLLQQRVLPGRLPEDGDACLQQMCEQHP